MVDSTARASFAAAIRDFGNGSITNDELVARIPESQDPAIRAIDSLLWFFYDDLFEHRMTAEYALNSEARDLFDRCVLFLETEIEYGGTTTFIDFLAVPKRFYRWLLRRPRREIPEPWWPFDSEEQLRNVRAKIAT